MAAADGVNGRPVTGRRQIVSDAKGVHNCGVSSPSRGVGVALKRRIAVCRRRRSLSAGRAVGLVGGRKRLGCRVGCARLDEEALGFRIDCRVFTRASAVDELCDHPDLSALDLVNFGYNPEMRSHRHRSAVIDREIGGETRPEALREEESPKCVVEACRDCPTVQDAMVSA